jgi:uncharacterized protein Veg
MKRGLLNLNVVKEKIKAMRGVQVDISINRGRRKIESYRGIVENVYPSVFTVQVLGDANMKVVTCSYSDVLCGYVKIDDNRTSFAQAEAEIEG